MEGKDGSMEKGKDSTLFPLHRIAASVVRGGKSERSFWLMISTIGVILMIVSASSAFVQNKDGSVVITPWLVQLKHGVNIQQYYASYFKKIGCGSTATRFSTVGTFLLITLLIAVVTTGLLLLEYLEMPLKKYLALISYLVLFVSLTLTWLASLSLMYSEICGLGISPSKDKPTFRFGAGFIVLLIQWFFMIIGILYVFIRRLITRYREKQALEYLNTRAMINGETSATTSNQTSLPDLGDEQKNRRLSVYAEKESEMPKNDQIEGKPSKPDNSLSAIEKVNVESKENLNETKVENPIPSSNSPETSNERFNIFKPLNKAESPLPPPTSAPAELKPLKVSPGHKFRS